MAGSIRSPAVGPRTAVTLRAGVLFGAAIAIGAAACAAPNGGPSGIICTAEARAAFNITVVDSLTGAPAAFTGLWARVVDGAYRDSTSFPFTNPQGGAVTMALAWERRGTFAVTVHAAGYSDWNKTGVVVTGDQCHVTPVQLTARMAR